MSIFSYHPTTYELILFIVFSVTLLIQLFYYLIVYIRLPIYRAKSNKLIAEESFPPVSIIICARDEEENLKNFLPSVLEQNYPNFEVIVVDDCSSDNTEIILEDFKRKYKNLRTTTIKKDAKFTHGKKLALTIGIKAAKHDWLLLTDADCKPVSNEWVATMASNFTAKTEVVLGYGGFFPRKGFLNKLIRFDAFFIAVQYLNFALFGKPYMGVGRNLAYKKDLFFNNKGFAAHMFLDSGDDDLFIHKVANKKNTTVEYRHKAHTYSNPRKTFFQWRAQKKRHLTTGPHYRTSIKIWLAFEPFTRVLFWGMAILLIIENFNPLFIAGLVSFRLLVMLIILKISMNRLNEKKILIISLFYDLFSPILFGLFLLENRLTTKKSRWK